MATSTTKPTVDEIFAWLGESLPKAPPCASVPPPDSELLDLAWEAVQSYQSFQWQFGVIEEVLMPLAASDGGLRGGPVRMDCLGGEASYGLQNTDDPERQVLRWQCGEEYVPKYQGRIVEIQIRDQIYVLKVNRRGVAELEVPSGLDLSNATLRVRHPYKPS